MRGVLKMIFFCSLSLRHVTPKSHKYACILSALLSLCKIRDCSKSVAKTQICAFKGSTLAMLIATVFPIPRIGNKDCHSLGMPL